MIFFFFQAEDGIRDLTVTGVQTCALPIWARGAAEVLPSSLSMMFLIMVLRQTGPECASHVPGPGRAALRRGWWPRDGPRARDRKSTRLNSSHSQISYAVFCLKKKKKNK